MADAPRLLTRTGGRSSFLVGVEPKNASVMLETVLTIHSAKSRPETQTRQVRSRGQAGRAGQPAREQETNKGKNRRRAMQSAGCTPNRRRER